jgi:alpha-amylase
MATKAGSDGTVHQYFSPYSSPYEAFMNFMNIVSDLELRVKREMKRSVMKKVEGDRALVTLRGI